MSISGAILAGGHSSRMGADKALLLFRGKPFIWVIAETIGTIVQPVSIISDHADRYSFLHIPVYNDILRGCGPLGGLHAALRYAPSDTVFVISCDLPLVRPQLIQYLIDHADAGDATVLQTGGSVQPLCALYRTTCLPAIERNATQGNYALKALLDAVDTTVVTPSPDIARAVDTTFPSINTPEEYESIVAFP